MVSATFEAALKRLCDASLQPSSRLSEALQESNKVGNAQTPEKGPLTLGKGGVFKRLGHRYIFCVGLKCRLLVSC